MASWLGRGFSPAFKNFSRLCLYNCTHAESNYRLVVLIFRDCKLLRHSIPGFTVKVCSENQKNNSVMDTFSLDCLLLESYCVGEKGLDILSNKSLLFLWGPNWVSKHLSVPTSKLTCGEGRSLFWNSWLHHLIPYLSTWHWKCHWNLIFVRSWSPAPLLRMIELVPWWVPRLPGR